jgi:hypothetical protein
MRRLIPAALLLLLASCGGEQSEAVEATPVAAPAATTPTAAPAAASTSQFARVTEEQGLVTITFTENRETRELFGDPRQTGKRKYTLGESETVLYEVKPNDEGGFKLRTPDGKLRWKVKVTPEKIKVSDNEENDRPFELKVRGGDRVKVVAPGDRELGNVRYASGKLDVETAAGKSVFSLNAPKFAGAYGVLLLDGVPDRERYIILAELLSRGR